MQRRQIPEGYVSSFESHTRPAQPEPPPPIIEQKQAETLMGHCLKQFIKQRLYGKLINYTRLQNSKKSNFNPPATYPQSSHQISVKSATSIKDTKQQRYSQIRSNLERQMDYRYNSVIRKANHKVDDSVPRNRSSFGQIQDSLIMQGSRHRKNKSAFSSKNSIGESHDKSLEYDIDKYKYSSFLSAIDEDEDAKVGRHKRKSLKLSPIANSNNLSQKLEKIKSATKSPSIARFQVERYNINPTLWQSFCRKPKPKYDNQLELSLSPTNEGQPTIIDNKSFNANSVVSARQSLPPALASIQKAIFMMPKNGFSKDTFHEYMGNPKLVIKSAAQALFYFFQLNGKLYDEMKQENYKQLLEVMVTAGPRVWAVCAFRFFDRDLNGTICVNDIFKLFKDLDQLQSSLKEFSDDAKAEKTLQIVANLKDTLQKMRQIILQKQLDDSITKKSYETLDNIDIKYLEESILRKKQVRYSDLILILGDHIKNTVKETKRSVIETTKQIRIKLSSCYRYSFLATDHNEQTRQDRDHIQSLKQNLKRQKMEMIERQRENELINKKLPGIDYCKFLQMKFYRIFKDIAFSTFGIQVG